MTFIAIVHGQHNIQMRESIELMMHDDDDNDDNDDDDDDYGR
jgi:hypothetical protein